MKDSLWQTRTHMGTDYAALLVEPGFSPPKVADELPKLGSGVVAVATVPGRASSVSLVPKKLHFSGYEWEVLQVPVESLGVLHTNRAANAWTDEKDRLHLRITQEAGEWTGAEIMLSRSLGYGSYSFGVRDMPRLEPATTLGILTWDPLDAGQNHREIDVQLSQWGDPDIKNAQFTIQPYYVPANVYRFASPSTTLTHSFRWEPERMSFRTTEEPRSRVVAEHTFTSGIPSPGGERVHINLYVYGKSRAPQQNGVEVVLEKFAYLP
jgi:hypothetical protein